jgi:hypothetical protein
MRVYLQGFAQGLRRFVPVAQFRERKGGFQKHQLCILPVYAL